MKIRFFSKISNDVDGLRRSSALDRYANNLRLGVRFVWNATVVPCFGLYEDGEYLTGTCWGGVDSAPQRYDGAVDVVDATVYYLGTFHPCWGHLITDGMRLLWGLLPELGGVALDENVKFVYSMTDPARDLPENFKELIAHLGVTAERLVKIEKPTRFARVYVADEAYWYDITTEEKRTYSDTYQQLFEILSRRIVPERKTPSRTVYLSRAAWKRGNPDFGESLLVRAFRDKFNCEIVSPEQLSFVEMVRLLQETKTLITTEGSISHNALFLQPGSDIVIIRKAGFISYYQLMINQLKNLNVTYIDGHRTHHFYYPDQPYFGPFFLYVNRAVAEFLGCRSHFPLVTYCHYRGHLVYWRLKRILVRSAVRLRDGLRRCFG